MNPKHSSPLDRAAWIAFLLATLVNIGLVTGLVAYSRTLYLDHLIAGLAEPGMPDAGVQEALLDHPDTAHPRLAATLTDPSAPEQQRIHVARILGASEDRRAIVPLQKIISDPSPAIRSAAIRGLCSIPDPEATDALARLANDEVTSVRRELIRRLEAPLFYRPPTAPGFDLLLQLATDPDEEVRSRARVYLERFAADPTNPFSSPARQALQSEDLLPR